MDTNQEKKNSSDATTTRKATADMAESQKNANSHPAIILTFLVVICKLLYFVYDFA